MTHTYATLPVSATVLRQVAKKMEAAGYQQAVTRRGGAVASVDMQGIALVQQATTKQQRWLKKLRAEARREAAEHAAVIAAIEVEEDP